MEFSNTSTNMVQTVTNIVEGYKAGSFRALAQEPVQNALDARRPGQRRVEVEYRLMQRRSPDGAICHLLAITDKNTTGLRGPLISAEELRARNYKLKPEENWAAFEAQGYTKENEDALGSRGQGKSAFLYHSFVPGDTRRMLMLYDTLLEDGEYRLGMRFARPVDQIMSPPLSNEAAQAAIQGDAFALDDDLVVPLGLQPLRDIGARAIVPFINEAHVEALQPGGELSRWLQRCWWRAIQLGKLRVSVVDENGYAEQITVPKWWQDLRRERGKPPSAGTWQDLPDGGRACTWGEKQFDDGRIRRLVMLHSDALSEDEITNDHPEFAGIQILRGMQWIETRGARQDFGDYIPQTKRAGFRAFVEFDKKTDSLLREAENSQHDGFKGQRKIVRAIRSILAARVREFSDEMGWETAPAISAHQVVQRENRTHTRFLETFLNPNGRKPGKSSSTGDQDGVQLLWDCRLDLDYPDPKSARVDWGQSIRSVHVEVDFEPGEDLAGNADLILEWVDTAGKAREIHREKDSITKQWGEERARQQFSLGDWQVVRGKTSRERQIECPEPGQCRLRAVVEYRGKRVKSAARTVYAQSEPPPPPERNPVSLSISAENISARDQKRIDHGQVLEIQISARNRSADSLACKLGATLENEVFARDEPVILEATPAGDRSQKADLLTAKRQLLDPVQSKPESIDGIASMIMPESSGSYLVRAELFDAAGESVASASKRVYFQRDPGNANDRLPFEIAQASGQKEMWKLDETLTKLTYPRDYPLYKEMREVQRQRRALQGNLAFIAEISANGLLEWALRPKDTGDDSNYDQLLESIAEPEDTQWERYIRRLEQLGNQDIRPIEYARAWRETVAIMLDIFRQEHD